MSVIQLLAIISHQIALVLQGQASLLQATQQVLVALRGDTGVALLTTIESQTSATNALVTDGTYGLVNVHAMLDIIGTALVAIEGNILAAIAALPAGSALVNPTPGIAASDVWTYISNEIPGDGKTMDKLLADSWRLFNFFNLNGSIRADNAPDFIVTFDGTQGWTWPTAFHPPTPDYTDILPTDTVVSWLNRTDTSGHTWELGADGRHAQAYGDQSGEYFGLLICTLIDADLVARAAQTGAPIWPGEAGVTFGDPVVLTESAIVAGPMDGIKLVVDSGPGASSQWGVDTFHSYFRGGYVVFLDVDGHADTTQFIGPSDNIFVPKGMSTAGSVVILLNKVSGVTVTPWTLA